MKLTLVLLTAAFSPLAFGAGVVPKAKSIKEATHFDFTGSAEWRYEVSRQNKNGGQVVSVQFFGVKPEEIQSLENFRDKRVSKISVHEGLNKDAVVEFWLADRMNFFDYQTESPSKLIFDVYSETKTEESAPKAAKEKRFATMVSKSPSKKSERKIASVEKPELGNQPALPGVKAAEEIPKIIDITDKDYKRFTLKPDEIRPEDMRAALLKSEAQIYLPFPESIERISPTLKDLETDQEVMRSSFAIEPEKNEENQIVRLMIRLFKEEKYTVALRTSKFFKDKFPKTKYEETIHLLKAEIYYKLWLKDKKTVDFETALSMYKEHLVKFPEAPINDRLNYFIGMTQYEGGQYLEALATFQAALKNNPQNPYLWSIRMAMADAYRALRQSESALQELGAIENDLTAKKASSQLAPQARFRRGDVYFKIGNYNSAIDEYAQAIKLYPKDTEHSTNAYYNTAEAQFRQKDYKKALDSYRLFIQKFPESEHSGYAMHRIGNIFEILGAAPEKTHGAYMESSYLFKNSPAAYLSRVKLGMEKIENMKPKEAEAFFKEIIAEMPVGKVEDVESFAKLAMGDGLLERKEFQRSLDIFTRFYKEKINSDHLPLFKNRIYENITAHLRDLWNKKKSMDVIQLYLKEKDGWLKGNTRADTDLILGRAYEKLNLFEDAKKYYSDMDKRIKGNSKEQEEKRVIFEDHISGDSLNLRLAKVSLGAENFSAASKHLENVKNSEAFSPEEKIEFALATASVAEKENRYDIAIAQLKKLAFTWKDKPELLIEPSIRISKLYDSKKNKDEALAWANKAVDLVTDAQDQEFDNHTIAESCKFAADLNAKYGKLDKASELYKLILEKYTDEKTPAASLKYKLGKIYFDQNNLKEAERVWSDLKKEEDGALWAKMADENLSQKRWSDKLKRYVGRNPAAGGVK